MATPVSARSALTRATIRISLQEISRMVEYRTCASRQGRCWPVSRMIAKSDVACRADERDGGIAGAPWCCPLPLR